MMETVPDREVGISIGVSRAQRGLLWREWRQHGALIKGAIALWTISLWVLVALPHPACILALGSLFAAFIARDVAGSDQAEGCEEFSLALPPTRSQRFLTRLLVGGVPLVFLVMAGVVAIRLEWPQALWGLVVDSGFTGSFFEHAPKSPGLLWDLLGVAVPVALFSWTFTLCALAPSRNAVIYSWITSLVITGALMGIGAASEYWLLEDVAGVVPATLLGGSSIAVVQLGHRAHRRKEATTHPGVSSGRSPWPWVLGAALALLLILGALSVYSARRAAMVAEREHRAATEVRKATEAREHRTRQGEENPDNSSPERPDRRRDDR